MIDTYPLQRRCQLIAQFALNRNAQLAELEHCRQSVVHWVNDWCFTYDPRKPADRRDVPFDLYAIQMEFLLWIKERQQLAERTQMKAGGTVPKSRERGVTWLCCAYAAHAWLFSPGSAIGFGSLKLEEVDEVGNMNTILEKIRYILRRLPPWMMPRGYVELKHATHAKLINPANGSSIVGEGGDNIGRGGKTGIFFLDEAAHVKDAKSINSALSANTHCRIDVSTYHGAGGDFYQKCYGGDYVPFSPSDPEIRQFSMFSLNWREDPTTSEAWADAIKKEIGPTAFAEQYDMDPHASLERICIPSIWVRAAVELNLPESEMPKVAGMDVSEMGDAKTVLITRRGARADMPIWWQGLNTTLTAHRAADEAEKHHVSDLYYDGDGPGVGVKGTLASSGRELKFKPHAIRTGEAPTDAKWKNGKTSKEMFLNKRAEYWWMLRERFEKAFEYKEGLAQHPTDEMISIPNHHQLIMELSMPIMEERETGKMQLESKRDMRTRGVASPDFADALVLAFARPPKKKKMVFW